jgi:phosphoesterase RecJ-like protein
VRSVGIVETWNEGDVSETSEGLGSSGQPDGGSAAGASDTNKGALAAILAGGIDATLANAAWAMIAGARRILLIGHEHPDPDALGSCLGLAHALRPLGKECVVGCPDPPPATFTFLPGVEQVVTELPDEDFDLVIALDAGELARYGRLAERHADFFARVPILNLDHHRTSVGCGRVNIIDVASAATAELITLFLLNRGVAIGRDAAVCLLAGIITDTRSFEFDATTSRTLEAGAYLVERGAVPADIIKPMYRMKPLAKARLWGLALGTLGSALAGRLVWAEVRPEMLAAAGATADMDDGLPTYLIDIEGAKVSALFKAHEDGTTRVSLRAGEPYDAAAMAAHFGGGGHLRAAGFAVPLPLERARDEVLAFLEGEMGTDLTPKPPVGDPNPSHTGSGERGVLPSIPSGRSPDAPMAARREPDPGGS